MLVRERTRDVYMFQITTVVKNVSSISSWSLNKRTSYFEAIGRLGQSHLTGRCFSFSKSNLEARTGHCDLLPKYCLT